MEFNMRFLAPVQMKLGIKIRQWIRKLIIVVLGQVILNQQKVRHLITGNSFKFNNCKFLNKKIKLTRNNNFLFHLVNYKAPDL